MLLQEAQLLLG